jgi:AcrR family transcriptional regulator
MARPTDPDKRRALARRAAAILQREGLELPVAQLAARLGIKRPTLLYHFPSYAPIFETVLEEVLTEQIDFVLARIAAHEHPIERLYAQLRAVHEFHHGREERILFLSQAIAATGGTRARAIIEASSQLFEAHRQAQVARLQEGIVAGTVAPCDAEALVAIVRALVDGLMIQRVLGGVDLGPAHALVWERLLAPLIVVPAPQPRQRRRSMPAGGSRS